MRTRTHPAFDAVIVEKVSVCHALSVELHVCTCDATPSSPFPKIVAVQ
jgi:hypothetical protein